MKTVSAQVAAFLLLATSLSLAESSAPASQPAYELVFSTFFGSAADCRGMYVDALGNAYVGGCTWWQDKLKEKGLKDGWVTTEGAFDRTHHGDADMAISKWSPEGRLLWSTLIGGPGHDRPYAIRADAKGFVYLTGRAGDKFPVTADSYWPKFAGKPSGPYGINAGVTAKLSPDGSKVLWGAYLGGRDMTVDDEGSVYVVLGGSGENKPDDPKFPEAWFANAYRKTAQGHEDVGIIKIASDGKKVIWATFIGGSKGNYGSASLCVGPDRCPVLFVGTPSDDMPTTPGAHSDKPSPAWVGKLSADGSQLLMGTYIGGDGHAGTSPYEGGSHTHDVAQDAQGNVFIGTAVKGKWPVTPGAFQTRFGGGKEDYAVAKFSPVGKLLAATYVGGSGEESNGPDTLSVDQKTGDVIITGASTSLDYPVTPGCLQPKHGSGKVNGVVTVLANDLGSLVYSTFMGGKDMDNLRANGFGPDSSFWVAGMSGSTDFPLKNPYQPALKEVEGKTVNALVLAKFKRVTGPK